MKSLRLATSCRAPLLGALLLALFVVAAPRPARAANDMASCTVRIIHAKPDGNVVDAKLEPLKAQLTRPPLSAWKSFSLVRSDELKLTQQTPVTFAVPGEHQGGLQFLGTVEANGKQRLRLRLEILDGTAKLMNTVFVLDNGGTVLQAGIKHEQGLLVLGFTCKLGS